MSTLAAPQRSLTTLIHTAKTLQQKAEQAHDKAEQYWTSLGLTLAELKARTPADTTWPDFVRKHFDYSRERADELIRIGNNTTTVAKVREQTRMRVATSRKKAVLRSTEKVSIAPSTSAQRQIDKEAAVAPVSMARQINILVEDLSRLLSSWCDTADAFIQEHQQQLASEDGGPSGLTGKDCLTQSLHASADRLLRLAQTLDGR
jgi:hypothetical protein